MWRKGESICRIEKGKIIINSMKFSFILEIAVKQNDIFDVWGFICYRIKIFFSRCLVCYNKLLFLAVLGMYSIRQKFSFIILIYKKSPFIMDMCSWRISIKHPRKLKMLMMKELSKWNNGQFAFKKMTLHLTDLCFCRNKVTNSWFGSLF